MLKDGHHSVFREHDEFDKKRIFQRNIFSVQRYFISLENMCIATRSQKQEYFFKELVFQGLSVFSVTQCLYEKGRIYRIFIPAKNRLKNAPSFLTSIRSLLDQNETTRYYLSWSNTSKIVFSYNNFTRIQIWYKFQPF